MGTQRTEGRHSDKLGVLVVDENPCDADTASYMLAKLDFQGNIFNLIFAATGSKRNCICIWSLFYVVWICIFNFFLAIV